MEYLPSKLWGYPQLFSGLNMVSIKRMLSVSYLSPLGTYDKEPAAKFWTSIQKHEDTTSPGRGYSPDLFRSSSSWEFADIYHGEGDNPVVPASLGGQLCTSNHYYWSRPLFLHRDASEGRSLHLCHGAMRGTARPIFYHRLVSQNNDGGGEWPGIRRRRWSGYCLRCTNSLVDCLSFALAKSS